MTQLKRLIHEVHRRSLWQVFAIYAAVAWIGHPRSGSKTGSANEQRAK
jgi:hypothetical protein